MSQCLMGNVRWHCFPSVWTSISFFILCLQESPSSRQIRFKMWHAVTYHEQTICVVDNERLLKWNRWRSIMVIGARIQQTIEWSLTSTYANNYHPPARHIQNWDYNPRHSHWFFSDIGTIYIAICDYLQNILSKAQIYEWTSFHRHLKVDHFLDS